MKFEIALAAMKLAAMREILEKLAKSGNAPEVGRKALLTAFILDPTMIGTQRQLAARLGVSEGRASQMLKTIRRVFMR